MIKLVFLFTLSIFTFSCNKSSKSCFDESLVHQNFCTADCPGFVGCDDKTYCNECEAARLGIGPK